ncbi:unnamed protein product [Penicillium olsonii]|nr:unnamed protein product [Penicillium olsonii]
MPPRQRRPRPKVSLWARFRWWLLVAHSPLQIRNSLCRLRSSRYPLLDLIRMFIPYPSWYYPIQGPHSLRELIEDEQNGYPIINAHFGEIHNLRAIPVWRWRDTPLRSIYRLYELHLSGRYALMGWETEYFFGRTDWKLEDIPDPQDPDPLRYAVVASIMEELHEAVNWRLGLGLRRNKQHVFREEDGDPWPPFTPEILPKWTAKVPPLDKDLLRQSIPASSIDDDGNLRLDNSGKAPHFARRHIVTTRGWLYTV